MMERGFQSQEQSQRLNPACSPYLQGCPDSEMVFATARCALWPRMEGGGTHMWDRALAGQDGQSKDWSSGWWQQQEAGGVTPAQTGDVHWSNWGAGPGLGTTALVLTERCRTQSR